MGLNKHVAPCALPAGHPPEHRDDPSAGRVPGGAVDIIEPCGFPWSLASLRRAGMDYLGHADITRHVDWASFRAAQAGRKLTLLTTKAKTPYWEHPFDSGQTILLGRESRGVPEEVHSAVDNRLLIPVRAETRSLNVALAAAMVVGEALRQINAFSEPSSK